MTTPATKYSLSSLRTRLFIHSHTEISAQSLYLQMLRILETCVPRSLEEMRLCTTTLCTDIGAAENEYLVNEITLNGLPWGPDTAIGVLVCQRSFWEHCVITQASLGLDLIPLGSELERTLGQVVEELQEEQTGTARQKNAKSSSARAPTSSSGTDSGTVLETTLEALTIHDPEQWESKRLAFSVSTTNKWVVEWKEQTHSPSILDLIVVSSLTHDIQSRHHLLQYQCYWYVILIGRLLYGNWPPKKAGESRRNGIERDRVERIALAATDIYQQEMARIEGLLRAKKTSCGAREGHACTIHDA